LVPLTVFVCMWMTASEISGNFRSICTPLNVVSSLLTSPPPPFGQNCVHYVKLNSWHLWHLSYSAYRKMIGGPFLKLFSSIKSVSISDCFFITQKVCTLWRRCHCFVTFSTYSIRCFETEIYITEVSKF
jgi:hypothetical protein